MAIAQHTHSTPFPLQSKTSSQGKTKLAQPLFHSSGRVLLNPPPAQTYHPVDDWTGQLILSDGGLRDRTRDVVLFRVRNAPREHDQLIGRVVYLCWQRQTLVQHYVQTVSRDIQFTPETRASEAKGNLHPTRLDGAAQVGPLESLAGARSQDDVMVALQGNVQVWQGTHRGRSHTILRISQEPVQISGHFYGLVTFLESPTPELDRVRVCHYNPDSRQFDGVIEVVQFPQVAPDARGIPRSTVNQIERSPFNRTGWYIYGTPNAKGKFVVQAIAPRALLRVQPHTVLLGEPAGIDYIDRQNWANTAEQKGRGWTTLIAPTAVSPQAAIQQWQEGDRALVIHLFGGIGGKKAEPTKLGVVTGHYAFGVAEVTRDRLTGELRFAINYYQIYGHNPDGIISGAVQWESYLGDLKRGWLGTRPVSDVIVKLDAITQDYDFGGDRLSPLQEFIHQLTVMMARYRTGDGTGGAIVTPTTSCVQDSSQALYVTIKRFEQQVEARPAIQNWLRCHPNHPETQRFQQLVELGRSLERELLPLGLVRADWQKNAQSLAGTRPKAGMLSNLLAALTTWNTLLPRRAHDQMAKLLLRHNAQLWFIRTNQIGGINPEILPLAPTVLLGKVAK